MDDVTVQQAIQLSKAGRKLDARKLLRPFLEVDPENEKVWLWYANSFDSTDEKLKALQNCLIYCPDSKMAIEGIRLLQSQMQSSEPATPEESTNFAVNLQNSQGVMFTESGSFEKDLTPFSDEVNISNQISPFMELPEQPENLNDSPANKQPQINSGTFNGQKDNSPLTGARNTGYTESPLYAENEKDNEGNPKSKPPSLQTDNANRSESSFRVPLIIMSVLGVLFLVILSVITIVLFVSK